MTDSDCNRVDNGSYARDRGGDFSSLPEDLGAADLMNKQAAALGGFAAAMAIALLMAFPRQVHAASSHPNEQTISIDEIISSLRGMMSNQPAPKPPPPSSDKAAQEVKESKDAKEPKESKESKSGQYRVYPSPAVANDDAGALGARSRAVAREEPETGTVAASGARGMQFFPVFPAAALPDELPQFLPLSSNRDLGVIDAKASRAVIFIHDVSRNADHGVSVLSSLAGEESENTLILAPLFPLEADVPRLETGLPDNGKPVARWPLGRSGGAERWQYGGDSLPVARSKGISSFTAVDLLVMYLADRRLLPNLRHITIVGHGAGGDFVHRYAAFGQAPEMAAAQGVETRFLIANPSSFLYFTSARPKTEGNGMAIPSGSKCEGENAYPYGLADLIPYGRRLGGNATRLSYPEKRATYLVGDKITRDPFLDLDCSAMAQGKDRMARAIGYEKHLASCFGDAAFARQRFKAVSGVGYDAAAVLGSRCGVAVLFGNGECQ